jgi:hypothetical protein
MKSSIHPSPRAAALQTPKISAKNLKTDIEQPRPHIFAPQTVKVSAASVDFCLCSSPFVSFVSFCSNSPSVFPLRVLCVLLFKPLFSFRLRRVTAFPSVTGS